MKLWAVKRLGSFLVGDRTHAVVYSAKINKKQKIKIIKNGSHKASKVFWIIQNSSLLHTLHHLEINQIGEL